MIDKTLLKQIKRLEKTILKDPTFKLINNKMAILRPQLKNATSVLKQYKKPLETALGYTNGINRDIKRTLSFYHNNFRNLVTLAETSIPQEMTSHFSLINSITAEDIIKQMNHTSSVIKSITEKIPLDSLHIEAQTYRLYKTQLMDKFNNENLLNDLTSLLNKSPFFNFVNEIYSANNLIDSFNTAFTSLFIKDSFGNKIMKELSSDDLNNNNSQSIKNFFELIIKRLFKSFPQKKHAKKDFIGILSIVLGIIFFLYGVYSSDQSEQKIFEAIQQSETRIINELREASKEMKKDNKKLQQDISNSEKKIKDEISKLKNQQEVFYIVKKQINLYSKTTNKSDIISILYPNQKVQVEKQKNKNWIYINYFDYIEGITKTGWVLKKYLKRVVL